MRINNSTGIALANLFSGSFQYGLGVIAPLVPL